MATAAKRTLRTFEDAGENASDALFEQIAALRKEVAAVSSAVGDYGGHALDDVQHNAMAIAKQVRHQGAAVAKQVTRQASVAGRVVHDNPVPVALIALGGIALLAALLFARD